MSPRHTAPAAPASSPATSLPVTPGTGAIPDVQAFSDARRVAIDRVGVKDVIYPMRLRQRDGGEQQTVATISMYVSLPHTRKGTHMSRFLEVLNQQHPGHGPGAVSPDDLPAIARAIRERLDAADAHFKADFTYFIRKKAPVTGQEGVVDYRVSFECSSTTAGDDLILGVRAPATSLCPCSKEISAYGAHNQRCIIEARVRLAKAAGTYWIEDLAATLEKAASMEVYAVLKRPDEKFVTEKAYDNPKFVEDIVRDLALAMEAERHIVWYSISSENFESIHNHQAYAEITRDKRLPPPRD